MTSTQIDNTSQKNDFSPPNQTVPLPAQWTVPAGAPGYNPSPNAQMWNAPIAQQWNPTTSQQWNCPPFTVMPPTTQPNAFHEEFLKGKPKALGVILIVVGILHIAMGIGLFFTASYTTILSGIPFWGAVCNIIAGSLSVSAVSKPNISLVKGALGLSIFISIFSVLGLILNILDYFVYYYCYGSNEACYNFYIGGHVLHGLFIITYLLQFSVSVSLSVFGCRAQNHPSMIPTQVFVLQNSAPPLQPFTVPGSSPTYSPQPPSYLPYITQSGTPGGPTA